MGYLDNFKAHKKSARRTSLDGFLSPNSFKKPSGSIEFGEHGRLGQGNTKKLDDFDRPDGYHPTVPAVAGTETHDSVLPEGPRLRKDSVMAKPHVPKQKKGNGFWRKLRPRRPKSWPKFFKRSALAMAVVAFIIAGLLAYKIYLTQKHVLRGGGQAAAVCDGEIPLSWLNKEGDGRVNVLLAGVGGPGHPGPYLTDTIIVASVDTTNNKVDMLSIPRDWWVQQDGGLGPTKINAIFPNSMQRSSSKNKAGKTKDGLKALDQVVSRIIGTSIHYNVLVNFKAFRDSVNAVGGVTFNVPETLYDPTVAWENNWNPVIAKKGSQTFNGARALLYARSRETSSDFARAQRQRQLLVALKDKVLSLGTYSNPVRISNLLNSFGNNIYTDFDLTSVKCLYKQMAKIDSSNIKSLDLVTPPHNLLTTGSISGLSTVFPRAGLFEYKAIWDFVHNALKDGLIAKENANVIVLNGTNVAGLATKQAAILKSYGYNVVTTGDPPSRNYQKTVIVDLTKVAKKYTLNYLEKRYKVKSVNKLPDDAINSGGADFVIILGADATNST